MRTEWTACYGDVIVKLTDAELNARIVRDGACRLSADEMYVGYWHVTRIRSLKEQP